MLGLGSGGGDGTSILDKQSSIGSYYLILCGPFYAYKYLNKL